jgi:hypothetical protein
MRMRRRLTRTALHAKAARPARPAANCQDCHGGAHEILGADDPKSPVNHANIPVTCGRCHGQKFLMESNGESAQPFISYQESVHGLAIEKGSKKAAVCTDCHGAHEILPANDPKVADLQIQCSRDLRQVPHGGQRPSCRAFTGRESRAATDGSGLHGLPRNPLDQGAHRPQLAGLGAESLQDTCARCHQGVRLSQEFGVPGNRVTSYLDSYHGLAAEGGSVVAANCSSCHGVHNILPSSDPRSTINRANLDATCGKCHKGVTQKFTLTKVHMEGGHRPRTSVRSRCAGCGWFIWSLILLVIGAMFLHNAIIWRSKAVARRRMQNPMMTRMTDQPALAAPDSADSFIVLVITGFALKFPNSWFAAAGHGREAARHHPSHRGSDPDRRRHLSRLLSGMTREGRRLIRDFAPRPKDAFDAWGTMRYYLGLSKRKAEVRPLQLMRRRRNTGRWSGARR